MLMTHVFRGGTCGVDRKGTNCRVLRRFGNMAQIEFEDGYKIIVTGYLLRRIGKNDELRLAASS